MDYVFVDRSTFEEHIAQDEFLEHAEFVGNHYGTPLAPIRAALERGQDVVLEIEVEGAKQVRQRLGNGAIMIFIMPPSLAELRRRLEERATESQDRIEKRLARAEVEMAQTEMFDYVVVNDELEQAVTDLHTIQRGERARLVPETERTPEQHRACQSADRLRPGAR
ncbi:guanylate kinase [Deinococcus radiophilus]|uniref:guanylate kinase n=1 Tax=Deinococcus radiophilus TaxID=32062 RepID=UPI0036175886